MRRMRRIVGMMIMAMVAFVFVMRGVVPAMAKTAADYQLTVTTNRAEGVCSYQLTGVDLTTTSTMQVQAAYTTEGGQVTTCMNETVALNSTNCINGVYSGTFSMDQLNPFVYSHYTVTCVVDGIAVVANQTCDFSANTNSCKLSVSGDATATSRKATVTAENVDIVPGKNTMASLYVWKSSADETTAVKVGQDQSLAATSFAWDMNMADVVKGSGTYKAKVVLTNGARTVSFGGITFDAKASAESIKAGKTEALEKKNAFDVTLKNVKVPVAVKTVSFHIYDEDGKVLYTQNAIDKNKNGKVFYAQINLRDLKYKLQKYTVKAYVTDVKGNTWLIEKSTTMNEHAKAKSLTVMKNKSKRTTKFVLKGAYIPGNIKGVLFQVYYKKDGKFVLVDTLKATANGKNYRATMNNKYVGAYHVYAYGETNWGAKIALKKTNFKIAKGESAKNGWFYEKYNGKVYKFYYENNKKLTDLTKVLGLKESSASNINNFYIELNRAACCVTVYAYDSVKKKYIIPVRTFTVSVGRDTYTNAGAGSLNTNTSFTPIGDFSICTNGQSVKYSMKPMNEPDGSVCYARWATHVVGNVYFHSIAVGSDSHYALSPTNFNRLGGAASAGCIRMMVADAKWIYDYASTGSKVKIVVGSSSQPGPLGKTKTIKIASSIHYDPTDPEISDSRKKSDYAAGLISGYRTKAGVKVGY